MRLPYRDLETGRLLLRRPRDGDALGVFESYGRDPEVTRYLTWPPHGSLDDAEDAEPTALCRPDTHSGSGPGPVGRTIAGSRMADAENPNAPGAGNGRRYPPRWRW